MLYIKFEDDDSLNGESLSRWFGMGFADILSEDRNQPPPLLPALLERTEDLPAPPTFDQTVPMAAGEGNTLAADSKGSDGSAEKKLPKWLKMGSACSEVRFIIVLH